MVDAIAKKSNPMNAHPHYKLIKGWTAFPAFGSSKSTVIMPLFCEISKHFAHFNPNEGDVWKACQVRGEGRLLEPPYLSQPFMVRFSKFFCLVKACENRHWFLFHKWLPIVHRLAARGRQSGEGQSRQYFQAKNLKISIFSYKYVIYLSLIHISEPTRPY